MWQSRAKYFSIYVLLRNKVKRSLACVSQDRAWMTLTEVTCAPKVSGSKRASSFRVSKKKISNRMRWLRERADLQCHLYVYDKSSLSNDSMQDDYLRASFVQSIYYARFSPVNMFLIQCCHLLICLSSKGVSRCVKYAELLTNSTTTDFNNVNGLKGNHRLRLALSLFSFTRNIRNDSQWHHSPLTCVDGACKTFKTAGSPQESASVGTLRTES
jgi:hypothetical protein